jgi:chitinase
LYPDPKHPTSTPFSTSVALDYYVLQGGVRPSKINLGSPLYGRAFANTDGIGKPFNGTGAGGSFGNPGIWDYKELSLAGNFNSTIFELPKVGASYSYDKGRKYLVSYDTVAIAQEKAKYVVEKGFGGSMWWDVSMDRVDKGSLVAGTLEVFGRKGGLERSQNQLEYPESMYENLRSGM